MYESLKESNSFSLFHFQSFKHLHISLLHFLWHLDNHLFVYTLKRFLIRRLLRQQHRFDVYHLQALAFIERIVADPLYVGADSYFRKLLIAIESLCSRPPISLLCMCCQGVRLFLPKAKRRTSYIHLLKFINGK